MTDASATPAVFTLSEAVKELGHSVNYYPSLARIIGLEESVFLCNLIYWTPRGRHKKGDGWIYKSAEDIEDEIGLSYKVQIRIRKKLVKMKLIEEKHERTEHRIYFRINKEELDKVGKSLKKEHMPDGDIPPEHLPDGHEPPAQQEDGTLPLGSSYKEASITTDTTHIKPLSSAKAEESKAVEWLFDYYLKQVRKNANTYTLTDARKKKGLSRLRECLAKTNQEMKPAVTMMKHAIEALAASDFHMEKGFTDWEKQLFGSQEKLESWLNKPRGSPGSPPAVPVKSVSERMKESLEW